MDQKEYYCVIQILVVKIEEDLQKKPLQPLYTSKVIEIMDLFWVPTLIINKFRNEKGTFVTLFM